MGEWILGFACAVVGGVALYFWNRKTQAEVALANKLEEAEQLRADDAADLDRQARQYQKQIDDLNGKLQAAQEKTEASLLDVRRMESEAKESKAALDAEKRRIADMEKHYRDLLGQMKSEFKSLSGDILKEKREEFEKDGIAGVKKFTDSLVQEVKSFRERVDAINAEDIKRTTELKTGIRDLLEKASSVSEEADKLATAIRSDAQVTGYWGETQLMRVLELGGLQRTVDFDYQETFASAGADHADLRTDVLVKMPEDRWIVVDAKTTMSAYVDYVGENGERNAEALGRIVASLVEHVKEMKTAGYHKKLEATTGKRILNTMLMYIPFEEVYLTAMKSEVDGPNGKIPLREWAWQNDIVFVNASGLIPLVKMLAELWARDRSERKVLQIKEAAESLIEKFRTFLEGSGNKKDGFLSIGAGLMTAVGAFNESIKRLSEGRGSILKKLSDLKDMGVSSTEKLPVPEQIETREIGILPTTEKASA